MSRVYSIEVSDKFETTQTNHIFALAEAEKDFVSKTYKLGDEKVTVFKDIRGRFSMVMGDKVPVTIDEDGILSPLAVALEAQFDAAMSVSADK
ncbi:MAG: hypothetical protein WC976_06265 [Caldisericia bacterium]